MRQRLLDTDIFSYVLRRREPAASRAQAYIHTHGSLSISVISYYEVLRGMRYSNASRLLDTFERYAATNPVLLLDIPACRIAADLYATLRREGRPIEDADLLVASIALANDCVLVTHNTAHYARIPGLKMEDWAR
jgi:tRNA(fMet)-specific endonuclease VapC